MAMESTGPYWTPIHTTAHSNKEFSDKGNSLGIGAGLDRLEDD